MHLALRDFPKTTFRDDHRAIPEHVHHVHVDEAQNLLLQLSTRLCLGDQAAVGVLHLELSLVGNGKEANLAKSKLKGDFAIIVQHSKALEIQKWVALLSLIFIQKSLDYLLGHEDEVDALALPLLHLMILPLGLVLDLVHLVIILCLKEL